MAGDVMRRNEDVEVRVGCHGPDRDEIVVGIDDSAASAAALQWAVAHSRSTGLPLCLVHTWQLSAIAAAAVASGAGEYLEAAAADARARATRWVLDTVGGEAAEVGWTLEVREAAPGPELVARGHGASLLVVGTHEHTGIRRAVSGSVSHYVLSHADVPVIAVPAPGPKTPPPKRSRSNDRRLAAVRAGS
jgi:nucleotide-binding universal stress UspA family protein